jgi:hypothetical protein
VKMYVVALFFGMRCQACQSVMIRVLYLCIFFVDVH